MPSIIENHKVLITNKTLKKRAQKKYNIPVVLTFKNSKYRYNSILEAELDTGISYHLIFDNATGKIKSANGTQWEFENGADWLRYHARHVRFLNNYKRKVGFNG